MEQLIHSKQKELAKNGNFRFDKKAADLIAEKVYEQTIHFLTNLLNTDFQKEKLDAIDLFSVLTKKDQMLILNALNK